MKVSLLLPRLALGGLARVSLDLAREFSHLGHEVEILLKQAEGEFLSVAQNEFSIIDLQAPRILGNLLPKLIQHLRRNPPDVLIAALWPFSVIAPIAARISGFDGAVIVSEHSMIYEEHFKHLGRLRRLEMRMSSFVGYRLATARIGVSQGVCENMARMSLMAINRMTTIHNPVQSVAPPDSHDLEKAEKYWGDRFGRRMLTVGRAALVKNHALLLHAFAQLRDKSARLLILGPSKDESSLRALAEELDIAGQLILPGFHADPAPFYATADLFVLSSNFEGLPTVLIEALSSGLPVVSTDCGTGPAEILENGRWGRLTPVGDAPALARAMQEALAEEPDRDALRARAAHFSPERAARAYLAAMGLE